MNEEQICEYCGKKISETEFCNQTKRGPMCEACVDEVYSDE